MRSNLSARPPWSASLFSAWRRGRQTSDLSANSYNAPARKDQLALLPTLKIPVPIRSRLRPSEIFKTSALKKRIREEAERQRRAGVIPQVTPEQLNEMRLRHGMGGDILQSDIEVLAANQLIGEQLEGRKAMEALAFQSWANKNLSKPPGYENKEIKLNGERSPIATWLAETLRTLLPQIIQRGWASEDAIDIDSMEKRLRAAARTTHCQVSAPRQVCAWVRVPS